MIEYLLDAQGGFTCGDTETGLTSYAYPTSTHATLARRVPERIAAEMVKAAKRFAHLSRADYDTRNWQKIYR